LWSDDGICVSLSDIYKETMSNESKISISPPRPVARRWGFWFWVVILVLLIGFGIWRVSLAREISHKLDKIAADGFPTSGVELEPLYKLVPETNNAAVLLEQACNKLVLLKSKEMESLRDDFIVPDAALIPEVEQLMERYLATNAESMGLAREALQRTGCHYKFDAVCGMGNTVPSGNNLTRIGRLFLYESVRDSRHHAARESLDNLKFIAILAQTLDSVPSLSAQRTRMKIFADGVTGIEFALSHCEFTDSMLVELREAYGRNQSNRAAFAFIGERAMAIPYFRLTGAEQRHLLRSSMDDLGYAPHSSYRRPTSLLGLTGFSERDLNCYLDTVETGIAMARLAPPRSLQYTNFLVGRQLAAERSYCWNSASRMSAFSDAIIREARDIAQARQVEISIAVERFRLVQGRLPESLLELVPRYLAAVPEDPFDGHPMRFQRTSIGYTIYSIGPDGVDDGGLDWATFKRKSKKQKLTERRETFDIPFVVAH
jgi:hypothetical protein